MYWGCRVAVAFLCVGIFVNYLLIRLLGVVVWEYEMVFNTKNFIINSKIIVLCSCNRSVVLTYIYKPTCVSSCWLESEVKMIHTHTHPHTHAWLLAQSHIHLVMHSYITLTRAFPLHTCSVTRNLLTYATTVGRVFLIDCPISDYNARHPIPKRPFSSSLKVCIYRISWFKIIAVVWLWLVLNVSERKIQGAALKQ